MNTGVVTRIMLSSLFYTTLLGTTIVMPLILATSGDAAMAVGAGNANADASFQAKNNARATDDSQVWERSAQARAMEEEPLDIGTMVEMHRALRFPQMDIPRAGQAMTDKSGPDAAMVRPGKARAKAIRA